MLRFLVAAPFLLHGLAHLSGFLASWTRIEVGYAKKPCILSKKHYLNSGVGRLFGILWLLAMIGLVGTGMGILFHQDWWSSTAIIASALSLVVIVPWWATVPPGAKFGAFFDLLVITLLLLPSSAYILQLVK